MNWWPFARKPHDQQSHTNPQSSIPDGVEGDSPRDIDLVDEAQVYLAYGRRQQAAEILCQAIAANPQNVRAVEALAGLKHAGSLTAFPMLMRERIRTKQFDMPTRDSLDVDLKLTKELSESSRMVVAQLIRRLVEIERAASRAGA